MVDAAAEERFGPYVLGPLIGRGGMGEVRRAWDTRKDRRAVALKRLPAGLAEDTGFHRRFLREAELVGRLRDPHVIPIHDYGQIEGRPYLDMRLVEGTDAARVLDAHGAAPPARAVDIVVQVAQAVGAAHREGLVHRDVKPGNVLLTHPETPGGHNGDQSILGRGERDLGCVDMAGDGRAAGLGWQGSGFVYLIDFGIAANLLSSRRSSVLAGTAAYMAPERFAQGGDQRVDVYALACTLFELLSARPPYDGDFLQLMGRHTHDPIPRVSETAPGVPAVFDDVIAAGMAKDPEKRPPSAAAFAAAAQTALAGAAAATDISAPRRTGPRQADIPTAIPSSSPVWPAAKTGSLPDGDPGSSVASPGDSRPVSRAETLIPAASVPRPVSRPRAPDQDPARPELLHGGPDDAARHPKRRRWLAAVAVLALLSALGTFVVVFSRGDAPGVNAVPASFIGTWEGRMVTAMTTGSPQPVTMAIEGGEIGASIGEYRYPQLPCTYDLTLLQAQPTPQSPGETMTVEARRVEGSPGVCTAMRIDFLHRPEVGITGTFPIQSELGPARASVGLQRAQLINP